MRQVLISGILAAASLLAYVHPASAAEVDTVQTGVLTTFGNGTTTVAIQDIDPTRSFLIFNSRFSNSSRAGNQMIRGRILNNNTLEFVRVTNQSSAMDITWTVVSFSTGVSVQRGETNQTATATDQTLTTPVVTDQSFILWSKTPDPGDDAPDQDDPILAELVAADTLQFRVDQADPSHVIWWQVVEFTDPADIHVQWGSASLTGTTTSDTIALTTPVDTATTFVLCGYRSSGNGNDVEERLLRAELTDANTITVTREDVGDDVEEILCHAVELTDGSMVQTGTTNFAAGQTLANEALNPFVDPNKSIAFSPVQPYGGTNQGSIPTGAGGNTGKGSFTFGLSSGNVEIERNNAGGDQATVTWFVVTFNGPYGGQGGGTQCGTTQLMGDGVVSETITAVNPTKSFVMAQGRHNSNRPPGSEFRATLVAPDQVDLELNTNDPTHTIDVSWCVVTYNYGIRVQRGQVAQTSTNTDVTISPIGSLSQAFLLWTKTPNDTDVIWSLDDPILGSIRDTQTIRFEAQQANAAHIISWQVVEFLNPADVNVQSGSTQLLGTDLSVDVTLGTPIDPATSFMLVGFETSDQNQEVGRRMVSGEIVDMNTIHFERDIAGDDINQIVYQVVHLKEGSTVQRGVETLADGQATATVPLATQVDNERTLAFASTQVVSGASMGRTDYAVDDIAGVASVTMTLPAAIVPSDMLVMERNNASGSASIGWYVWEIPNQVLSVELIGFKATGFDRQVRLVWNTASEIDTVGFQLMRSESVAGPFEPIGDIIPAQGNLGGGAAYAYDDVGLVNGTRYYYKLEEIAATTSDVYGPIEAVPNVEEPGCSCHVTGSRGWTTWALWLGLGLMAVGIVITRRRSVTDRRAKKAR